ncbi:MAG: efflux RND transporter periplasmic adaptor subunit [Phycisphaerae bacterium]
MTTTLSSASPGKTTSVTAGADYVGASSGGRPWVLIALAGAIVVAGAGAGGWKLLSLARTAREVTNVSRFTLEPRSFEVVLEEKGELKAAKSTDIKCEVEGRATIISLIAEGSVVETGDLLVELASDQIDERIVSEELKESNAETAYSSAVIELEIQRDRNASDIRKAELNVELKKVALDKYLKGDWTQQLRDAEIAIEEANINYKRREEDRNAYKEMHEKGYVTKTQFEEKDFAFQKAEWDREKAKQALHALTEYTHKVDVKQRQSDYDEALKEAERIRKNAQAEEDKKVAALDARAKELALTREKLAKLRAQKEKCRITAPTPGFVVYYGGGGGMHFMGSDNQIKEGASVHERQVLMSLPDTSRMHVVVRVHEAKMDKLAVGQDVTVEVEGLPDRRFTGKVAKIAMLADTQNRWINPDLKEYETEIELDPTDAPLKPGTTAHVKVHVADVEHALAVPVQSIFSKGGRRYVFRDRNGMIEPVEVKLGVTSTEWAEIVDGLEPRDQILLAVADDLKRDIPDAAPDARSHPSRAGMRRSMGGAAPRGYGRRPAGMQRRPASAGANRQTGAGHGGPPRGRSGDHTAGRRGPERGSGHTTGARDETNKTP